MPPDLLPRCAMTARYVVLPRSSSRHACELLLASAPSRLPAASHPPPLSWESREPVSFDTVPSYGFRNVSVVQDAGELF